MAKYSTFVYSAALYGTSLTFSSINPDEGPSIGGNEYIITGSGFSNTANDDDFEGVVLDALLWTDISAGTGVLATNSPHLLLQTGTTASSICGVETVSTFLDFQGEIRVVIPTITAYPSSSVELIHYSMYVDVNNHVDMVVTVGSTSGTMSLTCSVTVGGSVVDTYTTTSISSGLKAFKILRYNSRVYCYMNNELLLDSRRFVATAAYYRIYNNNLSATYNVSTVVESFMEVPYVVFGTQIDAEPTVVSDFRIRGLVPASIDDKDQEAAYKGLVNVYVISGSSTAFSLNAYEYYYLDTFTAIDSDQEDVRLSVISDSQVVTPSRYRLGLGEGK